MSAHYDPRDVVAPAYHFIAGAPVFEGEAMDVRRPSDGATHTGLPLGDADLVDRAAQAGAAAQKVWIKRAPRERARVLRLWADLIDAHQEEIARLESVVSSRFYTEALAVDVANSAEWLRYYAECSDKIDDTLLPTSDKAMGLVASEPYGVVGAIAPWNFPLILAMWKVAPALAAGNAIVLKPSEFTPFSVVRVAELGVQAGLPAGLFNVAHGLGPSVGAAIVRHPLIGYVAFTGSTATGRTLMTDAAQFGPKPVGLELGGKGAQLVLADAGDLDRIAEQVAWGVTRNGGQLCYAGSRLVVHDTLAEPLLEKVAARFAALRPGATWAREATLPPILNQKQAQRIESIVNDAIAQGARARCGAVLRDEGGAWFAPTILEGVAPAMRAVKEEIFGPVLTVQTFRDADEGFALAEHEDYGLATSVYTRDVTSAIKAARRMQAGTVWVNTWGRKPDFTAPFGGWKRSGFGQEAGKAGFEKYRRHKTIWFDLT